MGSNFPGFKIVDFLALANAIFIPALHWLGLQVLGF